MRGNRARRHLLTRELGEIGSNGAYVGRTRVGARTLAPSRKTFQARAIGGNRVGRQTLDARDIGDKRVNGIVQVKGYDRSPPNRSERVAK